MDLDQVLLVVRKVAHQAWTVLEPLGQQMLPLLKVYPWPGLAIAFVAMMVLSTFFRVATSFFIRLLLLPFLLVASYVMLSAGILIYQDAAPLIIAKVRTFF